jgi:predicted Zn-dependent protease
MARFCRFVFWLIVICSCSSCLFAQDCPVLVVPKVVPGTNMFNEQQEVWLGDAEAASLEQSITIVDDAKLTAYLQHIVDRLALGLGSSQLQFRVKIYDAPTPGIQPCRRKDLCLPQADRVDAERR